MSGFLVLKCFSAPPAEDSEVESTICKLVSPSIHPAILTCETKNTVLSNRLVAGKHTLNNLSSELIKAIFYKKSVILYYK